MSSQVSFESENVFAQFMFMFMTRSFNVTTTEQHLIARNDKPAFDAPVRGDPIGILPYHLVRED